MRNGAGALLAAIRVKGNIGAQNRGATRPQFIAPRFLTSSLNKLSEINWAAIGVGFGAELLIISLISSAVLKKNLQ